MFELTLDDINRMISIILSATYRPLKYENCVLLGKLEKIRDQKSSKPCLKTEGN